VTIYADNPRFEQLLKGIEQLRRNGSDPLLDELPHIPGDDDLPPPQDIMVVSLEEFVAVDEPGAAALLGTEDAALIPEDGDVMIYGDGGSGKTTLAIDLACHLAAGKNWLEIPVPRTARVLLLENEGPRPLLRKKLRRKLDAWTGAPLDKRINVFEAPWGKVTLATAEWREELALKVAALDVDLLIAGPLTRIGMNAAGTLQEVAAFMRLVDDLRHRCGRSLAVILIHHENRAGTVSGAWEPAGDTLLHLTAAGNGRTVVHVQKARWDNERHATTMHLAWTDGEGFRLEGDRDYLAEIDQLLTDDKPRIAKEIAAPEDKGGIGANLDMVKQLLKEHPERFESCTGEAAVAVGRRPNAIVWKRTQAPESVESVGGSRGSETETDSRTPLLRESVVLSHSRTANPKRTQAPESVDVE
jgi:AAA domain